MYIFNQGFFQNLMKIYREFVIESRHMTINNSEVKKTNNEVIDSPSIISYFASRCSFPRFGDKSISVLRVFTYTL